MVLVFAGFAIAVIGAILCAAARAPSALRLPTALAVGTVMLAYVRARPDYGARRGLPPGSLGLAASLDAIDDQDFYARAARTWGLVFKMSQFHQPVVCIADLQQGLDFMRSEAASLAQVPRPWAGVIPGGYVEFMDGSHHERYREILRRGLSGGVITASKGSITTIIRQELSALASGASTDFVRSMNHMTSSSLLRVFFGLSPDSPEAAFFQRQLAAIEPTPWKYLFNSNRIGNIILIHLFYILEHDCRAVVVISSMRTR